MKGFSWFDKPEGEGCLEKFCSLNYYAFWSSMPPIMLYYLAYKKIRNPLGVAYYYTKCAWPFHAAATTFAVTACGLANYRGKDDGLNWGVAGALAGAMPGKHFLNISWLAQRKKTWPSSSSSFPHPRQVSVFARILSERRPMARECGSGPSPLA